MTTPDPTTPAPETPEAPEAPAAPAAPAAQTWGGAVLTPTAPSVQFAPVAPPAPVVKNLPAAVLTGLGTMLAAALAYGFLTKALEREWSLMAIGIGFAVGAPLGKLGGRHPALPPIGALLTVAGVFLGELFGLALIVHEQIGVDVVPLFTQHFDVLFEGWKADFDAYSVLFIAIGAFVGFSSTKNFGRS